jgi:hypothetical protein
MIGDDAARSDGNPALGYEASVEAESPETGCIKGMEHYNTLPLALQLCQVRGAISPGLLTPLMVP